MGQKKFAYVKIKNCVGQNEIYVSQNDDCMGKNNALNSIIFLFFSDYCVIKALKIVTKHHTCPIISGGFYILFTQEMNASFVDVFGC